MPAHPSDPLITSPSNLELQTALRSPVLQNLERERLGELG